MAKNKTPTKILKKDLFAVQQTKKMCVHEVDIENFVIRVPLLEEPCDMEKYLQKTYGMPIQYFLADDVKNNDSQFNPESILEANGITEKKGTDFVIQYVRGDEFISRKGEKLRIFDRKKTSEGVVLTIMVVGDMTPNYPKKLEDAEKHVKSKLWSYKGNAYAEDKVNERSEGS